VDTKSSKVRGHLLKSTSSRKKCCCICRKSTCSRTLGKQARLAQTLKNINKEGVMESSEDLASQFAALAKKHMP